MGVSGAAFVIYMIIVSGYTPSALSDFLMTWGNT